MSLQNENHRKVFSILKKIKKSKLKKLSLFLTCGYFKIHQDSIWLFEFLQPLYPSFSKFDKEKLKEYLFAERKEKCSDNEINDAFSALFKDVLAFVTMENFSNNPSAKEDSIIQYYHQNHFYSWFEKSLLKKRNRLHKQPTRNAAFYDQQMQSFDQFYFHPETEKFKKIASPQKNTDTSEELENLKNAQLNLQVSFILTNLRYALEMLQRARILPEPVPDLPFLGSTLELCEKQDYFNNPILQIYVTLTCLAKGKSAPLTFEYLISLFQKYAHLVEPTERRTILQFLLNELSFKSRSYSGTALKKQVEYQLQLYRLGEEKDCLVVFDRIPNITFTNMIITFSKNGDVDFAKKFITNNRKYLPPPSSSKDEVVRFCWSCIYFYEKEYLKAFEQLKKKNKFTVLYLEHRARVILLCCEFELYLKGTKNLAEEDASLETIERTISNYIRFYERKPQLKNDKLKPYLNFGRILNRILKAKNLFSYARKDEKQKILKVINNYKSIAAENWLLNHIENL